MLGIKSVPWVEENKDTFTDGKIIACNVVGFEVPFSVQYISPQIC